MSESELERLRALETQCALMHQTLGRQEKDLANLRGGINRGLWIIGGGFLAGFVSWIIRGGMSGG